MSQRITVVVHVGGEPTMGAAGLQHVVSGNHTRSKMINVIKKPTYDELLRLIRVKLGLAMDERVARVIYKCPVIQTGSIFWTSVDVEGDDEIEEIYEMLHSTPGYSIVELIVKIEKTDELNDPYPIQSPLDGGPHSVPTPTGYTSQRFSLDQIGIDYASPQRDPIEQHQPNMSSSDPFDLNIFDGIGPSVGCTQYQSHNTEIPFGSTADQDRHATMPTVASTSYSDLGLGVAHRTPFAHFTTVTHEDTNAGDVDAENDDQPIANVDRDEGNNERERPLGGETSLANFTFDTPHHTIVDFSEASLDIFSGVPMRRWDGVSELCKGLQFSSKKDVQGCVKRFSIINNVQYIVVESTPEFWVVKCMQWEHGCKWWLRATKRGGNPAWVISIYKDQHTCNAPLMNQSHRQLDSQVIAECIFEMVKVKPDLPISVIIANMKERWEYDVPYHKAWYARFKALEDIYGNFEDSYAKLPSYLNVMQLYNPGTAYEFCVVETQSESHKMFRRVFWAFKPCIDGFEHCKPVLQIDGTFLTGKYNHTLLIATAVDGNNSIFPVAFAIAEGENKSSWGWFMKCVRTHVTQRAGLTVISDRHAGILSLFRDDTSGWKEPLSYNHFCLRHFVSNYNNHFHNTSIKDMLYSAGAQFQKRKFFKQMDDIKEIDLPSYNWAMANSLDKWTLSHDEGYRHGHATTNIAESINSSLKGVRTMPVKSIVEHTFARLVKFFDERRCQYRAQLVAGVEYTDKCRDEMEKRARKACGHKVLRFDRQRGVCQILTKNVKSKHKGNNEQTVRLQQKWCECGKFQGTKMPCSHAIAACMHIRLDCWKYVDKCYKLSEALSCYKSSFQPLAHHDYWPQYNGPKLLPDLELARKPGRPKVARIHNEMDRRRRGVANRCGICRQEGHNRSTCPNIEGDDEDNYDVGDVTGPSGS